MRTYILFFVVLFSPIKSWAFINEPDALWIMRLVSLSHDLPQKNYTVSVLYNSIEEQDVKITIPLADINEQFENNEEVIFEQHQYIPNGNLPTGQRIFVLSNALTNDAKKEIIQDALNQNAIVISDNEKDVLDGYALINANPKNRSKVLLNTDIYSKLNVQFSKYLEFLVKKVSNNE